MTVDLNEIEKLMEEMANAPREEFSKRQPGEQNSYKKYNKKEIGEKP